MTIRFTTAKDGYAAGSLVSTLTPTAEAAYVAAGVAVYDSQKFSTAVAVRRVLGQSGIPAIVVPNGTVATNGTITAGTALPLTYPQAWIYLPAGAVSGGSAGWYYCEFSSTTVGQVYTAYKATMDTPYVPAVKTAAVGSNSSYTQTTSADIQLGGVTVPANQLGTNGGLEYFGFFSYNNSAGAKTAKVKFGTGVVVSSAPTTTTGLTVRKKLQNRAAASQVIHATLETGAAVSTAPTLLSVDTTADVVASLTGQLATATDYIILENWSIEAIPAP